MSVELDDSCRRGVNASARVVQSIIEDGQTVYGVNTGFGRLANTSIERDKLEQLQRNLVMSHCTGVGDYLNDDIVRLILVLKGASLAQGYSGVCWQLIENLLKLANAHVYPCIPEKGSVGASGDLAPLAHMSAVLMGMGECRHNGKKITASEGLKLAGIDAITLGPKEGLALINGTQVSVALALAGLFQTEQLFCAALMAGALSVDAIKGSDAPFDQRIHEVRGQQGQAEVAAVYRKLMHGSAIRESHLDCDRVQDPYSIRCQPQVMGACLDNIRFVIEVLCREANAVSDNPLVFADTDEVLSGGNFHAEPVAIAADTLALAIAEIGALAERRIALLIDADLSGLPAFLAQDSGLNSGFMVAHVTAASLASENKSLAHPASVDSLPTSANQEDHVSMATFAARRLMAMCANTRNIIAIELLAAAQGIEFHRPLKSSTQLEKVIAQIRSTVPHYDQDRNFAPDIGAVSNMIADGSFNNFAPDNFSI